jgi:DNA-binding transcriptional ArsR family regulator
MPAAGAGQAADAVFAALSDGTRRSLYSLLGQHGEATATDLARELPVSRQAVQKHLSTLAGAGLVATRRAGREVLYRPTPAPMSEALAWMAEVGSQWDERLAALDRQLARGRSLSS